MNHAQNLKYKLEYLQSCRTFDKVAAAESCIRAAIATIADLEERLQKLEALANGN